MIKKAQSIAKNNRHAGVYVHLDELIRLQHKSSGFSFLPRQPVHSVLSGRHTSKLRGRGLNFEELRDYLPGDDTRNIDWKVTARTRTPYVRVYTEEKDRAVWLLVDQRVGMFFGSQQQMKSVVAAQVAAISAWRVLSVGDRVGALVFNDTDISVIPPHRSRERVMQILKQVVEKNQSLSANAELRPAPGKLNEVLKQISQLARHDCLVCLITDADGLDDESRKYITRLSEHNDVLAAFIYDPLEKEMPAAGRLRFADDKGQLETDTSNRKLRSGFQNVFEQKLQRMQSASRRLAIPVLSLHTGSPVAEQMREAFGHHLAAKRY
ncbi:MAG: DUF58 domain-containing protein [Gammaproteobacteria bacterium]|nr:DUF58 domain-containing protein [Gammaproteobacteria bacterium]NNK99225.1 DUF58 domain-containing protein [Xanthomonadales bacterium]